MKLIQIVTISALVAAGATQPAHAEKHTEFVDGKEFGADWPLTVTNGNVSCETLSGNKALSVATFTAPGGKVYALNGIAEGQGHPEIYPIWKDDPTNPGAKKSIGKLIQRTLSLCK